MPNSSLIQVTAGSGAPGVPAELRIRGINSINADKPPLVVVDGVIGGNYVPADVENVTVLKDAAAISLYGSRASGGVLVITTKKGTSSQPQFQFGATSGIKKITSGNFELMSGTELYDTQRGLYPTELAFVKARPEGLRERNFDWLDEAFQNGMIQNYKFSVAANPGKLAYYFSTEYFKEDGTFLNSSFERLNFRSNVSYHATDKLSFVNNINIQLSTNESYFYEWLYDAFLYLPWDNPYDENGDPRFISQSTPANQWYSRDKRNFVHTASNDFARFKGADLNWALTVKYQFNGWLSIETRNRIGGFVSRYDEFRSPESRDSRAYGGELNTTNNLNWDAISTNILRFDKEFGDHGVAAFAGIEGSTFSSYGLGARGRGFPLNLTVPGTASDPQAISGINVKGNAMSYFGEVGYNFQERYFLSASFRADGSSLFAPNRKWGYFPAASAAWLVSDETFLDGNAWLDFLKLRASYGVVGNDNIGVYEYLGGYSFLRQYNGENAGINDQASNPDLTWEETKAFNIGVDMEIFKRLSITVDAYTKNVDGMLFQVPVPTSTGFQFIRRNVGAMTNQGIELSLTADVLKAGDFLWNSSFNIAFNKNEVGELVNLDRSFKGPAPIRHIILPGQEAYTWYLPKWIGVDPQTGAPQWEKINYDESGNETGREITNTYGEAALSPQAISSALPDFLGGWTHSLSYKGLSLNVLFSYQYGNQIYNRSRQFFDHDGTYPEYNMMQLQDGWTHWQQPGDVATHPKLVFLGSGANEASSRYLEDGSYIRLRNVSLSYALPARLLESVKLQGVSFTASVDNLKTWTKYSGMDPDVTIVGGPFTAPGTSDFKYPISKQFLLGMQVTF